MNSRIKYPPPPPPTEYNPYIKTISNNNDNEDDNDNDSDYNINDDSYDNNVVPHTSSAQYLMNVQKNKENHLSGYMADNDDYHTTKIKKKKLKTKSDVDLNEKVNLKIKYKPHDGMYSMVLPANGGKSKKSKRKSKKSKRKSKKSKRKSKKSKRK
uniref:Uncharacterized protein n=1 Tax=viral metagenome TaxID=1070528 RepID=A0A6C0ETT3_9ZZZZ